MSGKSDPPSSPEPTLALNKSFPIDLIDMATEIQAADSTLSTMTGSKLRVIAEQIRMLQNQARAVLEHAQQASDLHRAKCPFRKRPGHIYHLYREADGTLSFSMLSPGDWNGAPPHVFIASYRLEADMSWTPLEETEQHDNDERAIRKLLQSSDSAGQGE